MDDYNRETLSTSLDLAAEISKAVFELATSPGLSVAKYSAVMGPAVMILSAAMALFYPDNDIKREFFKVNRKLERIMLDVNNLQDEVKKWAISNRYFIHVMNIHYQTEKMVDFVTSDISQRNQKEQDFIRIYKGTNEDRSLFILYQDLPIILETAMSTSNYHRRNVSDISNIFMDLLIMGITCSYTFQYVQQHNYNATLRKWSPRLIEAQAQMNKANSKCVEEGPRSARKDMLHLLHKMDDYNKSNQLYAKEVYEHLNYTYDWMNWVVVVHDSISSSSNTLMYCCNSINVSPDGSSNRIVAWYFPRNSKPMPQSSRNKFSSAMNSRKRPKLFAKRVYNYMKSNGLHGKIFVSRSKFHAAAAFDKSYGLTGEYGPNFVGYFV